MAATAAYGKAAYGWAMKRGVIANNPFVNITLSRRPSRRKRVLSDDELAALGAPRKGKGRSTALCGLLILWVSVVRKWAV